MKNIIKRLCGQQDKAPARPSSMEANAAALNSLQEELHLAGDELQRMENEGGISLNEGQLVKICEHFRASRRIKKILLTVQKW